ncbi:MAG: class I SAM-dependent methyltransferase [Solirubrobacteraceae bacterium]
MPSIDADLRRRRAGAYENPRPDVQALVPLHARRILDLGCSSGSLGAALKARQPAEVVGIEIDPGYAEDAAARLDRVIVADVEQVALPSLQVGTFDCLIAADVLEHLRDPWSALASMTQALDPGATAVVSLPNVRYWETFLALGLWGIWPRRDEGIFDRSHLRWFTLADALTLMAQADLRVTRVAPRYRLKPGDWRTERHGRRFARTPLAPFFVFQYVLAGVKAQGPVRAEDRLGTSASPSDAPGPAR